MYESATIGDVVWTDSNADGIQDGSESGLDGVSVNIYEDANQDGNPDGAVLQTTTTTGGGNYSFTGLTPNSYLVEFELPVGYSISPQDEATATETTDSDANQTTGFTSTITVASGEMNNDVDAGMYESATIGDVVSVSYTHLTLPTKRIV